MEKEKIDGWVVMWRGERFLFTEKSKAKGFVSNQPNRSLQNAEIKPFKYVDEPEETLFTIFKDAIEPNSWSDQFKIDHFKRMEEYGLFDYKIDKAISTASKRFNTIIPQSDLQKIKKES